MTPEAPAAPGGSRLAEVVVPGLLLTALHAVGLAFPMLWVASGRPDYFFSYLCDAGDILVVVLGLGLAPGLAATAALALAGRRLRRPLFLVLLAGELLLLDFLLALWGLQLTGGAALAAAAVLSLVWARFLHRLPGTARVAAGLLGVALLPSAYLLGATSLAGFLDTRLPEVTPVARVSEVPGPVVLLVFDAFPFAALLDEHRQLDAARFPHLARLARRATFYRNASTSHHLTQLSLPSMLSGRRLERGDVMDYRFYPDNLFRLLAPSMRLKVSEPYSRLAPPDAPAIERFRPGRVERYRGMLRDAALVTEFLLRGSMSGADLGSLVQRLSVLGHQPEAMEKESRRRDRAGHYQDMLASLGPDDARTFLFAHVTLPHGPWVHLPGGGQYGLEDEWRGVRMGVLGTNRIIFYWTKDEWTTRQSYQRMLLQAGYVDRLVGDLLDRLEALELDERATIAITSDHGEAFLPGNFPRGLLFPHSRKVREEGLLPNHAEILPVPLFLKLPGQREGRVSDENVELVDLVPTLAGVTGVPIPWEVHGRDLAGDAPPPPGKTVVDLDFTATTLPGDFPARFEPVARRRAWFAAGPSPGWLYRLGPFGELVGQTVTAQETGAPTAPVWRWTEGGTPGVWTGEVDEPLPPGAGPYLAIAEGDTITAVTRLQPRSSGGGYSFLAFRTPEAPKLSARPFLLGRGEGPSPVLVPLGKPSYE